MEHTRHAAVIPVEMGWSDVGTWDALWQIGRKDEAGNVKNMRFELGPPYALVRGGWKKDTVKIGDKITIEGAAMAKDPRNNWVGAMQSTSLISAAGEKLPTR